MKGSEVGFFGSDGFFDVREFGLESGALAAGALVCGTEIGDKAFEFGACADEVI